MVLISKERIAEACKAIFPKWESLQQHEREQLSLNVAVALQAYEASRPSPSADLTARCAEILGWRRTGLLKGDSLRAYADARWPNEDAQLQLAESTTAREAFELIVSYATQSNPAPAQDKANE